MKFSFLSLKTPFLLIISLFVMTENLFAANEAKPETPILGLWQTILEDKGSEVLMILDIHTTDTDSLECMLNLPEFGFSNIPYGKFLLNGNGIALPGFEASLDPKKQLITGTFTAFGPELNLTLKKVNEKPSMKIEAKEKVADWLFETNGAIWTSPTVHKGHVVFGNDEGALYSIKIKDKSTAWKVKYDGAIRSKAIVTDGNICFTSDDGNLYLLDFKTGNQKWKVSISNNISPRAKMAKEGYNYDYLCSAPTVYENRIYIGSMDSCMYAINTMDGSVLWKYKTEGRIRSTPHVSNGNVYVGSWDHFMYSLKASDGQLNWKYDAGWSVQSSPIIVNDKLIFGSRGAFVFALDKSSGKELWKTRYWGSWVESSPVLYDDKVYIGSSDYRKLCAINPDDGQVIMSTRLEGWAWPTPAVSDKYIYSGCLGSLHYAEEMHGRFYAFDRLTGKPVWQIKAKDDPDTFANGFASSPTLSDGWVFVGGLDGNMYGIKEE